MIVVARGSRVRDGPQGEWSRQTAWEKCLRYPRPVLSRGEMSD